jgi:hypothetical protein
MMGVSFDESGSDEAKYLVEISDGIEELAE